MLKRGIFWLLDIMKHQSAMILTVAGFVLGIISTYISVIGLQLSYTQEEQISYRVVSLNDIVYGSGTRNSTHLFIFNDNTHASISQNSKFDPSLFHELPTPIYALTIEISNTGRRNLWSKNPVTTPNVLQPLSIETEPSVSILDAVEYGARLDSAVANLRLPVDHEKWNKGVAIAEWDCLESGKSFQIRILYTSSEKPTRVKVKCVLRENTSPRELLVPRDSIAIKMKYLYALILFMIFYSIIMFIYAFHKTALHANATLNAVKSDLVPRRLIAQTLRSSLKHIVRYMALPTSLTLYLLYVIYYG